MLNVLGVEFIFRMLFTYYLCALLPKKVWETARLADKVEALGTDTILELFKHLFQMGTT